MIIIVQSNLYAYYEAKRIMHSLTDDYVSELFFLYIKICDATCDHFGSKAQCFR